MTNSKSITIGKNAIIIIKNLIIIGKFLQKCNDQQMFDDQQKCHLRSAQQVLR